MSRGRGGRFIEVTPPVFSGTGRRGISNLPITTGTRAWQDGCRSQVCLWCSVFPGSAIARRRVHSLRRSQALLGLLRSPYPRFLRLGRIRHLLRRRFRLRLRVPTRPRILPLLSPFRILPLSVIFLLGPRIPRIAVRTVIQRQSRPRVPSIWRARVTLRAVGLLMVGVVGRLRVLGIARVRLVQDWLPRWRHRMRWVVASPAC